jgi:outer membrane protein OmpA-like peptidoglycan-associated protein
MNPKENNMSRYRLFPLSIIAVAVMAACTTAPTQQLVDARSSYAAAQNDPQVVQYASPELRQAGAQLQEAEMSASKGESEAQIDQLAYVAKQRVTIAQETARQKAAEVTAAGAAAEREKMRLESRTAEADAAQRAAASSKLDAESSQRAAASSKLDAESSQRQAQDANARSAQLEAQLKELDAKKTERGIVITLGDVLFDTNKAELKAGGVRNVQKLADLLKEYPQRTVLVEGFTDSTGNSAYNQGLSERRAGAVRTALQDTGVSRDRIADRGYGQTFPVGNNSTAEGRQLNRRVEIIVSNEGKAISPR